MNKLRFAFTKKNFREATKDQRGLSLVELVIVLGIFSLLAVAIVGVFLSTIRASEGVTAGSNLSIRATAIANSFNTGLPYSTEFNIVISSGNSEVIIAPGLDHEANNICRYWAFGVNSNDVYYRESTTPVAIPSTAVRFNTAGWTLLAEKVEKVHSTYFSRFGTNTLQWAFKISSDNGDSFILEGASSAQTVLGTPPSC